MARKPWQDAQPGLTKLGSDVKPEFRQDYCLPYTIRS